MQVRNIIVGSAVGLMAVASYSVRAEDIPWEERPSGSRVNAADQWWCTSWRLGDHVETVATYSFEGNLKLDRDPAKKIRWWQKWQDYIEKEMNASIIGVSRIYTDVLMGCGPNGEKIPDGGYTQLVRWYESPMSFRGLAVVGLKDGLKYERQIRETENKFIEALEDPEYQAMLKAAKGGCVVLVASGITAGSTWLGCPIPPTVSTAIATAAVHTGSKFAMTQLAEQRKRNLKKLANNEFEDNGIEAKSRGWFSWLFKSDDVSKLSNLAECYNELFDYAKFYICGKEGSQIFVKKILDGSDAAKVLEDNASNPLKLPDRMQRFSMTADDNRARNILTRETIDVNSKLFGLRERHANEEWIADASTLNAFLHQDLKGEFSGFIVMKYLGDEQLSLTKFGKEKMDKIYNVRHIAMVKSRKGTYTKFSYEEPGGFEMRYDSRRKNEGDDTSVDIYVDIRTGYVIKVQAQFSRAEIKVLPRLKLSDGFAHASGQFSFSIDSESCPMRGIDLLEKK